MLFLQSKRLQHTNTKRLPLIQIIPQQYLLIYINLCTLATIFGCRFQTSTCANSGPFRHLKALASFTGQGYLCIAYFSELLFSPVTKKNIFRQFGFRFAKERVAQSNSDNVNSERDSPNTFSQSCRSRCVFTNVTLTGGEGSLGRTADEFSAKEFALLLHIRQEWQEVSTRV